MNAKWHNEARGKMDHSESPQEASRLRSCLCFTTSRKKINEERNPWILCTTKSWTFKYYPQRRQKISTPLYSDKRVGTKSIQCQYVIHTLTTGKMTIVSPRFLYNHDLDVVTSYLVPYRKKIKHNESEWKGWRKMTRKQEKTRWCWERQNRQNSMFPDI